jgi:hypothetical protein
MPYGPKILRFGTLDWPLGPTPTVWGSRLRRRLRREGGGYDSTCDVEFFRPLEAFGPTVETALEAARKAVEAGGASLDETPLVELRLVRLNVAFPKGRAPQGELFFEGTLAQAFAFPFTFEGPPDTFFSALEAASAALEHRGIIAADIQETPNYWVFPALAMASSLGAFFDRRTGRTVTMGSSMSIESWIWGYERGLLEGDDAVLVVTEIRDRTRTIDVLRRLGVGFKSWHLTELPFRLPGAADWSTIGTLQDAGDAFVWHVEGHSAPK